MNVKVGYICSFSLMIITYFAYMIPQIFIYEGVFAIILGVMCSLMLMVSGFGFVFTLAITIYVHFRLGINGEF